MVPNKISSILNGLTSAIFVVDGDRKILLANRAAVRLFGSTSSGHQAEEAGLTGLDFVRAVRHPDCLKAIDKVLSGHKKSRIVISLQKPVAVTYQVNVVELNDGYEGADALGLAKAVISFDDISHIREAEKMRSDFVANVSHELRSPLTALSGFIETLKGSARDDEQARMRFLDIMEGEAQRMKRLIADLLSLSKVEVNEYVRPTKLVDVPQIIANVVTTLSSQAKEERTGISLKSSSGNISRLPGDKDQLTQVFQNLIENAIRYSDNDTEIIISIEKLERSYGMSGPVLAIEIRDQGAGIPAHHISRLTERFYRIDSGRSRAKGGTGLGLAIVKHILNRHRGRLEISSVKGVGSTFTVLLPQKTK